MLAKKKNPSFSNQSNYHSIKQMNLLHDFLKPTMVNLVNIKGSYGGFFIYLLASQKHSCRFHQRSNLKSVSKSIKFKSLYIPIPSLLVYLLHESHFTSKRLGFLICQICTIKPTWQGPQANLMKYSAYFSKTHQLKPDSSPLSQ